MTLALTKVGLAFLIHIFPMLAKIYVSRFWNIGLVLDTSIFLQYARSKHLKETADARIGRAFDSRNLSIYDSNFLMFAI